MRYLSGTRHTAVARVCYSNEKPSERKVINMSDSKKKSKNKAHLIMCYGLSEDQINIINNNLPTSSCEVVGIDCFMDIIAGPQMVAITVWDCMDDNDKGAFEGFFTDIAPFLETVIVIGDPDVNKELRKNILVYDSFDMLAENLKYTLLGAYRKTKKSDSYSEMLFHSLVILKAITLHPYVTTQELADKLEVSKRSVQRYIEALRVSGHWIDYDQAHKGWVADMDWDPYNDISIDKRVERFDKE